MQRMKTVLPKLLATFLLALAPIACGESTLEFAEEEATLDGPALLSVVITDAPSDYIAAAEVDIGRVELVPADDGPIILLTEDGTEGFVNLLDLQNSATMQIAEAEVDPGSFAQLRLIVEEARVQLMDGYEFRDGSTEMDLKVPSGAQTGIKLNLHNEDGSGPLEIVPGESVLVLDFDVNRSFVIQGNPNTPAGIRGVIFTPSIRVTGQDVAASISGTVSTALDGVSVAGLTVVAEPTDAGEMEGYQTSTGTAITAEDGSYTIYFLVPGSYDVTVELPDGLGTDPAVQSVLLGESEEAVGADFEIIDVTGSVAGTVSTSLEGVSVEGLTVTATSDVEGAEPLTTPTAADGTYLFESVLAGAYVVTVEVGDDQLTDPAAAEIEVAGGEEVVGVDFEIVEDLTGSIAGTVSTDLSGFSVEGLTVTATPDAQGAQPVTGVTLANGTYIIDSVPAGAYVVTVEVGTGFATDPANVAVDVGEDEEVADVNFAVIEAGS